MQMFAGLSVLLCLPLLLAQSLQGFCNYFFLLFNLILIQFDLILIQFDLILIQFDLILIQFDSI